MSAEPARHLRVVDADTGEARDLDEYVQELQDQLHGAEKEIRAWRTRYANLARDKEHEARKHGLWPQAVEAFKCWQKDCNHTRSAFGADRFWLVLPHLETHGLELVLRAIAGAAFDPYTTKRKNGSSKRHDDWELIFRNGAKFEEFANRAPRDWQPPKP